MARLEPSRSAVTRSLRPASDEGARKLTLAATVIGSSLAFIDATVVIVALPQISEDLNLGLTGQQWVYLSYSLTLASLYLVAGAVGDRWGRRETFIGGAVGFAAASALPAVPGLHPPSKRVSPSRR